MILFNNDEENSETREVKITEAQTGESMESIIDAAEEEKIDELIATQFLNEHPAKFHKGNLRSGMSLDFEGSIIIVGDVNPGAEVKATGNILVLGALKGVAHAGTKGEKEAYVFALNMNPVQLRIADIITRFPETGRNKNAIIPEYAYVEDGKVYVSTFG